MLDRNSKKILKFLNKMHYDVGCYVPDTTIIDECKLDRDVAKLSIDHLMNLGLIDNKMSRHIQSPNYFYRSTLDGKMYFKNKYFELFMTIFKSVICPIIVSLITTLLTLLLTK